MAPRVIVVGGGCKLTHASNLHLADADNQITVSGLSAAHTLYLAGGNVIVLDKQGMFPASALAKLRN